jgi:UDP-GlcNAc:undecaprenyl-phosphate GlcNAc-1-phosphate transferase
MQLPIFQAVLFSIILSLIVAPACIRIARRFGILDDPASSPHKIHTVATPRAGGMVIFIVIFIVGALTGVLWQPPILKIFLASIVIFVFGIMDDMKALGVLPKLLGQLLAGLILIMEGISVHFLRFPPLDIAITLFWIVGITNAYNLVDSMDGLALGLAGLAAAFFMLATLNVDQSSSVVFTAILVGTCAGLFYYNVTPASLFLGDSGSQLLGFWLAAIGIIFTPSPDVPQLSSWFVPIMLMIVPIFDTTLVTISRLRRKRPFYVAQRDHTYHRLVALGTSPLLAVFTVHLAATITSCLALIALTLPPLWANLLFLATLMAGLAFIPWLERRNNGVEPSSH